MAETSAGSVVDAERRDLDLDGVDEIRLADEGQVVTVDLAEGAGVGSWDIRAVRHATAAVMRRRPEAYHVTLRTLAASADQAHPADPADGGRRW